jgi:phosphoribosylamine---glycine ligase
VVEERVEGEESSFHAFSDGQHFIVAPQTRDYKRAYEDNKGRLTGGMGSYRSPRSHLPFLRPSEWESVVEAERLAFRRWKGRGSNPGLRGIVLYDALMHTGRGFKVLERNSRGGNTEQINILTTMQDDLVEVCLRMIEGRLKTIKFSNRASVVTCVVPKEYGTGEISPKMDRFVDLTAAQALEKDSGGRLRVYPMDLRAGAKDAALMGSSRCVAVVGLAGTIEEARETSMSGARAIRGDVRFRRDIASKEDLDRSASHMRALRRLS